jgi:hypothetical protein
MYFPKSQIKTNLYTNGGEYILSTTKEVYIGYYYEVSTGKKYTGKFPQDGLNIMLENLSQTDTKTPSTPNDINLVIDPQRLDSPQFNNFDTEVYNTQFPNLVPKSRALPLFSQPSPTPTDYTLGEFTRYFCKKTNELKYIEINKETHNKLKNRDPKIAWDLYEPQSIIWQISGDKEQTFLSNKNVVFQLEQRQKWYGFSIYLKEDYLKYYLED